MKRCFILDENTVIAAYTGKNEHGEYDPSAANLLLDIACNCHLIVLTNELEKKILQKGRSIRRNSSHVSQHGKCNPSHTYEPQKDKVL